MEVEIKTKVFEGHTFQYPAKKGYDTAMPEINQIKLSMNKQIALNYLTENSKVFEPFASYGESSMLWNLKTENLYCIERDPDYAACFLKNGIKCKDFMQADNLDVAARFPIEEFDLIDFDPFDNPWPLFNLIKDRIDMDAIVCVTSGEGFGYKLNKAKAGYRAKKLEQYGEFFSRFDKEGQGDFRYFTSAVVVPYILSQLPKFKLVWCCDSRLIGRAVLCHQAKDMKLTGYPEYVKCGNGNEAVFHRTADLSSFIE